MASPRTVVDIIRTSAARDPAAVAVLGTEPGEAMTYGALAGRVGALGAELRGRGIGPSDTVLVDLPNGPAMLVATVATMCVAVCAPMNSAYTRNELEALAADVGAVAVVTTPGSTGPATRLAEERGLVRVEFEAGGTAVHGLDPGLPAAPDEGSVALLLHTAGTTARPKQVPLTHANLAAAAGNVVESLHLTPADRCLNVMPLFHSHGLLGAALSTLCAGASIACAGGMDPRRFLNWATELGCTWYTAASTLHQLVMDAPGEWKGLRFMRSASGPLPPQVALALEERFGAPMIEVYGMTEAYQIAANPLPPGERRLGTVGRPTGTDVALLGPDGVRSRTGAEGEILVRGPAVFGGYSVPVGANDEAFVDGWFRTGDLGRVSDDGYLTITGRLKEQINRGGEKVAPREIEEALLDHPDVADAMAFAIPDLQLGEEIGVAVVPTPGTRVDLATVRGFLAGRIASHKIPRRVLSVAEIPKTPAGKPQRLRFAEEHAAALVGPAPRRPSTVAPGGTTQERLAAMWQEILGLDAPPGPADQFFQLGGTSLAVMELVVGIEEDLGVDLPVLDVLAVPSLVELAARLDQLATGAEPAPLLRLYRRGSGRVGLVLIPGQMGMAVGLNLIADAVGGDVDTYLFDYPGHRPGQEPLGSIDDLAAVLTAELGSAGLTHNVALYGNSLGSWVAFETARRLAAAGEPPLLIGIGDMYSPYFATSRSPTRPPFTRLVSNRLRRLSGEVRQRLARALPSGRRAVAVERRDAVIAASARAQRSYPPRPYSGDLLVFAGAQREPRFGPTLGWEHHTTGRISTVPVPGQHSDLHRTDAVLIGRALGTMLRSVGPGSDDD
jgi:acyl-CoA synthetase (AMP-forming)/AMP-acid ligase II/surfactin synthase thioesterase subunit/acyl carrier protein